MAEVDVMDLPWRASASQPLAIYTAQFLKPDGNDQLVGVMSTREIALATVKEHNESFWRSRRVVS